LISDVTFATAKIWAMGLPFSSQSCRASSGSRAGLHRRSAPAGRWWATRTLLRAPAPDRARFWPIRSSRLRFRPKTSFSGASCESPKCSMEGQRVAKECSTDLAARARSASSQRRSQAEVARSLRRATSAVAEIAASADSSVPCGILDGQAASRRSARGPSQGWMTHPVTLGGNCSACLPESRRHDSPYRSDAGRKLELAQVPWGKMKGDRSGRRSYQPCHGR
jgi:hypothetical protein